MSQIVGESTFTDNLYELEATDPAAPETWNPNNTVLINNDVYLKQQESLFWATKFLG